MHKAEPYATRPQSSEKSVPSAGLPGAGGLGGVGGDCGLTPGGVERGGERGDGDEIGRRLGRLPPLEEFVDEAGVQVGGAKLGVFQNLAEEGEVGVYAADIVFAEGADHACGGVVAGVGPDGELDRKST